MARRLIAVTLLALSLLAGSFLLVEAVSTVASPTLLADGGPIVPPPPPLPWPVA